MNQKCLPALAHRGPRLICPTAGARADGDARVLQQQRVKRRELWNGCGEDGQVYFARALVQNYTPEGMPAAKGNICRGKRRNTRGPAWLRSQQEKRSTESKHDGSEPRCKESSSSAPSSKHQASRRSQPQPNILLFALREPIWGQD